MTADAAPSTAPTTSMTTTSTKRDIVSAYAATAARVGAWAVVAAVVMRRFGTDEFALLALVRGTLSILNYGTLGLGPAMIHHLAWRGADNAPPPRAIVPLLPDAPENVAAAAPTAPIEYANPVELSDPLREVLRPLREAYAAGLRIALIAGAVLAVLLYAYATNFREIHAVRRFYWLHDFVMYMGIGALLRIASDAPAAVLQVRDRITRDNLYQCASEGIWVVGSIWQQFMKLHAMQEIGWWFMVSGAFLFAARLITAASITHQFVFKLPKPPPGLAFALLRDGGVIVLGQLANYLYAPAAMILISRMLDAEFVAYYEAAVQVDAALLLLVSSVATVLLPKAAVAHAADDRDAVRRYYVRGTLGTFGLLALAMVAAVVAAPYIYPLWLGQEMRATRAILPILLISTVVGGSGLVGRSILIAMGKATPFTVAALLAGVAHVALAIAFVKLGWGLRGIVCATALVVIIRAGIWQPWYVLSTLRRPVEPRN